MDRETILAMVHQYRVIALMPEDAQSLGIKGKRVKILDRDRFGTFEMIYTGKGNGDLVAIFDGEVRPGAMFRAALYYGRENDYGRFHIWVLDGNVPAENLE